MKGALLPTVALAIAACTSSNNIYVSVSGGHGATTSKGAAGAQTASGSGAGTSTAGSTSSSGTTGSGATTGGSVCTPMTNCPGRTAPIALDQCDAGQELLLNLTTTSDVPVPCVPLQEADNLVAPLTTDGCGFGHFCVPTGTILNLIASQDGYVVMNLPGVDVEQSTRIPPLDLIQDQLQQALVESIPDFNAVDAFALIQVAPDGGASPCSDPAGWTVWAVDPDGGMVGAGTVYFLADTPSLAATATDSTGFALIYNIDPTVQLISPRADNAADDDAGRACPNINFALPLELTNQVRVTSGAGSVIVYAIP